MTTFNWKQYANKKKSFQKDHHKTIILSRKIGQSTIGSLERQVTDKCRNFRTNVFVKMIDSVRDYAAIIINKDFNKLEQLLQRRTLKSGYAAFTKYELSAVVGWIKLNYKLAQEMIRAAGWFIEPVKNLFKKKAVKCLTNGQTYSSMKAAAAALKCNAGGISKCCRGKQKTTNKLSFEYA